MYLNFPLPLCFRLRGRHNVLLLDLVGDDLPKANLLLRLLKQVQITYFGHLFNKAFFYPHDRVCLHPRGEA